MRRTSLLVGALGVALLCVAVYPFAPRGLGQALIYDGLALCGTALALYGSLSRPKNQRRPWLLLTAALGLFFIGDVVWDIHELAWEEASPVPSFADVAYLAGYGCLLACALSLRRQTRRTDLTGPLLDAGIVATAMAILCWEPLLLEVSDSFYEAFVAGIYPVGDAAVLALVATLVFGRRTTWTGALLVSGLLLLTVADVAFLILLQSDSYATGDWPDLLFMLGPAALACAAVAPDHAQLTADTPAHYRRVASVALACVGLLAVPFGFLHSAELSLGENVARVVLRLVFLTLVAGRLLRLAIAEDRARDRLGATSTRLASVVEHASVAVIYTTPDATVQEWNQAAERLFGLSHDAMVGGNLLDLLGLRERSSLWRSPGAVTHDVLPMDLPTGLSLVNLRREALVRGGRVVGYTVFASDATKEVLAGASTVTESVDEIAPVVERLGTVLHEVVAFDVLGLYAVAGGTYRELVTVTAHEGGLRAQLDLRALRIEFDDAGLAEVRSLGVLTLQDTATDDPLAWFVRDVSAAQSAILIALRTESTVHSLFLVGFYRTGAVTDEYVGLVEAVAPLLSRAVRRALVVEHEREAARRLEEIDALHQQLAAQLAASGDGPSV